jgi:hypothetical protein
MILFVATALLFVYVMGEAQHKNGKIDIEFISLSKKIVLIYDVLKFDNLKGLSQRRTPLLLRQQMQLLFPSTPTFFA